MRKLDLLGSCVLIAFCLRWIPPDLSLRPGQWESIRTFGNLQEHLSTTEQYFKKL